MAMWAWYSYRADAEAVRALGEGGEGDPGDLVIGHGVAITDLIMGRGVTDSDLDGGTVPIGETRIGEVLIGGDTIMTMCPIRAMEVYLDTGTDNILVQ
jgi:hypothetical protein